MRRFGPTATTFLFFALPLFAQTPAPAPTVPSSPERLDQVLNAWEQRMSSLENFSAKCSRTTVYDLTKKSTTFVGEAAFMKPNVARIDLTVQEEADKKDADKTNFDRMYCTGQYIFEYSPRYKKIIRHEIPKNDPTADNLILAFMRGMKAADAKKRFNMTLTKETEWYAYVYITPKSEADKQAFTAAQLTIFIKNSIPENEPNLNSIPCRLWYKMPNRNEVTYMFSDMVPNGKLDKDAFVPRFITGYSWEKANGDPIAPLKK